jgi:hypothetical protein
MGGSGAYGYLNGNPMLLLTPWDYDGILREFNLSVGNGCGYNTTTLSYPYLYWPAPDIS